MQTPDKSTRQTAASELVAPAIFLAGVFTLLTLLSSFVG